MTHLVRRSCSLLLPTAIAVVTLSCFEEPITESVEIRFLPLDAVMVQVRVRLAESDRIKDSEPARDRVEEMRRAIAEGRDAWSARLLEMSPADERITWDRRNGRIVRLDHKAIAADAESVRDFFRDTPIQATLRRRPGEAEFILVPGAGGRADRQEQERSRQETAAWSEAVVRYVEAGARLYATLERDPERAAPCFASLFKDLLADDRKDAYGTISEEEKVQVDALGEAIDALLGLFTLPSDAAFSIEERSRMVHDPFPAPLTVRVPGPILESEGFEVGEQGTLRVPAISLWGAFTRLETRWITPDPAAIDYEHYRDGKRPLDLEEFLQRRRSASPPSSAAEVVQALEREMRPAAIYRVRWSTENLPAPEGDGDIWDSPAVQ